LNFQNGLISWKIIRKRVTGNLVMNEEDTFMYVALIKVEKHVSYGELLSTARYKRGVV